MNASQDYKHHIFTYAHEGIMDRLEEDDEYTKYLRAFTDCQDKMEKLVIRYGEEMINLFNDCRNIDLKMSHREKEEMYYQGYRDCMKMIEILWGNSGE